MSRIRTLTGAAAIIAAVAPVIVPAVAAASSRVSTGPPRIVAKPNNVMVNTKTMLSGTNFRPNSTLTIKECSQKTWIVPQNPCDTTNTISVKTGGRGGFRSSFTVQTCPATSPGFSQTCYIGEPVIKGVDENALLGAVAITVTGP